MTKGELMSVIVNAIPYPNHISDIDLNSENDAIRFSWRGTRFRVTDSLSVGEVVGDCLVVSNNLIMVFEELLKCVARFGLHKHEFGR